ncbi:MAG: LPS export ABC transporter periplasmic protein LptC [Porphyromonas sp.]|nr:LPS export ABC transporter periplasmic protein LptC [Porphyromonas sp.]
MYNDKDYNQGRTTAINRITQPQTWGCVIVALYLLSALTSCGGVKTDAIKDFSDSISYAVYTRGVETLISDSGVTKYKLKADEWYIFSNDTLNQWSFPKGIYLEQFDTLFVPQATVRSDSAFYHVPRETWELIGNVEIINLLGDRFTTNRMFWNRTKQLIYSDEYVRVDLANGNQIEGLEGFESNENMTRFEFKKSMANFLLQDGEMVKNSPAPSSVAPTDSIPKKEERKIKHKSDINTTTN